MQSFSEFFKALSDPTRQQIIQCLKQRAKTPSELLEEIKISQPTLSHHLDILKRSKVINGERDGQFIKYALNMSVFDMAVEYLIQIKKKR